MIIKPETWPSTELPTREDGPELANVVEVKTVSRVSGRYEARADEKATYQTGRTTDAAAISSLPQAVAAGREELRLDVDGDYPQQTASGIAGFGLDRVHWIASLTPAGANRWQGTISYLDGPAAAFP